MWRVWWKAQLSLNYWTIFSNWWQSSGWVRTKDLASILGSGDDIPENLHQVRSSGVGFLSRYCRGSRRNNCGFYWGLRCFVFIQPVLLLSICPILPSQLLILIAFSIWRLMDFFCTITFDSNQVIYSSHVRDFVNIDSQSLGKFTSEVVFCFHHFLWVCGRWAKALVEPHLMDMRMHCWSAEIGFFSVVEICKVILIPSWVGRSSR